MAKIANLRLKLGQIPLLSLNIHGHNSVIFYPILTFFIFNCFFSKRIEWCQNQSFIYFGLDFGVWPHFCSDAMGKIVCMHPNHPIKVGTCPGLPLQLIVISQNQNLQNYRPEPPSPLNILKTILVATRLLNTYTKLYQNWIKIG